MAALTESERQGVVEGIAAEAISRRITGLTEATFEKLLAELMQEEKKQNPKERVGYYRATLQSNRTRTEIMRQAARLLAQKLATERQDILQIPGPKALPLKSTEWSTVVACVQTSVDSWALSLLKDKLNAQLQAVFGNEAAEIVEITKLDAALYDIKIAYRYALCNVTDTLVQLPYIIELRTKPNRAFGMKLPRLRTSIRD